MKSINQKMRAKSSVPAYLPTRPQGGIPIPRHGRAMTPAKSYRTEVSSSPPGQSQGAGYSIPRSPWRAHTLSVAAPGKSMLDAEDFLHHSCRSAKHFSLAMEYLFLSGSGYHSWSIHAHTFSREGDKYKYFSNYLFSKLLQRAGA